MALAPEGDHYLISDSIGSTVALTDENGALAARYSYEPYGALENEQIPAGQDPPELPILFQGQYLDRPTGLYKTGFATTTTLSSGAGTP